MAQTCEGCRYWRSASASNSRIIKVCHYLLDTGEKRGCPAKRCTRRAEEEKPERRREK